MHHMDNIYVLQFNIMASFDFCFCFKLALTARQDMLLCVLCSWSGQSVK